jgi:UDP-2,3-diacylglucosamine pyrophosphatase LpxH
MYKSLFISDTHLGSSYGNSQELFALLEKIEAEQLFLVGDIFNNSAFHKHPDVLRFIELIQSKNWKIIYIAGNNEDDRIEPSAVTHFFRDELSPKESYVYNNAQMSVYLEHGHSFHDNGKVNRLLRKGIVYLKWFLVFLRKLKRVKKSTLSNEMMRGEEESFYHRYIKPFAQKILRHSFKDYMSHRAKERGCSMVICGHFHIPEESRVKGIRYVNCGDWVKSRSYVVESEDGEFLLIEEK